MPEDQVYERNKKLVQQLAASMTINHFDADDVFQEVFLRYIQKKPTFKDETREKLWFIAVTKDCARALNAERAKREGGMKSV